MSHESEIINYILYSEAEQNVLPLSSLCHNGCVFCSHKNIGPADYLYRFYDYKRQLSEVIEHIDFLDPSKKVFIGESATKIFEGEPFLFRGILEVLRAVRRRVKKAAISITTSGGFIPAAFFEIAEEMAPLEINFSLNSYNESVRNKIVLDGKTKEAFENFEKLCACAGGVKLSVSLMALNASLTPADVLLEDIGKIRRMANISVIKIYLPRFSGAQFHNFFEDYDEFERYCLTVKNSLAGINENADAPPVILEPAPPDFDGGDILVHSVIPGSKAALKNVAPEDKIKAVNGEAPLSKTHAYRLITSPKKDPAVTVEPAAGGPARDIVFPGYNREKDGACGMVFAADIPGESIERLIAINKELETLGEKGIIVTTRLSKAYMRNILEKFNISALSEAAFENFSFGGNIDCVGLLTLEDIRANMRSAFFEKFGGIVCKAIVLSSLMFDHLGRDLNGENTADFTCGTDFNVFIV
jgi:wyosine [tRNA(Phe)-imidazoG37] synthetase (radical SAM superfamily)